MYDYVENWAYFVVYLVDCDECIGCISHNNRQTKCHKKRMESERVALVLGGFFGWCAWHICRHADYAPQNQKILFLHGHSNALLVQRFSHFNFAYFCVIKGGLWI